MSKQHVKLSYTEFEGADLEKFTFLGYMDELFPIKEIREQIKKMGWNILFQQLSEQLQEEGVIDFFFVIDDKINRIEVWEKGDILKIIEGDV